MQKYSFSAVLIILISNLLIAQQSSLAVLPFHSADIDQASAATTHQLLKQEILKYNAYNLLNDVRVSEYMDSSGCSESDCAFSIGQSLNADKVLFGAFNRLGDKIIVQYTLADVAGQQILLTDNITALYIEDLDVVVKRIAASVVKQQPIKRTVEVGLVTEQESWEPRSRKFRGSWGISYGYLYPTNGFDDEDRVVAFDFRRIYESRDFAITGLFGIRKGIALNVGAMYLFSPKDFTPYLGGGIGVHFVKHEYQIDFNNVNGIYHNPNDFREKKSDGMELLLSGGVMAFRTYNFRVMLNLDYSVTFNDYDDRAFVLTIGIMNNH